MEEHDYCVTFVGEYFSMDVHVQSVEGDEDVAVDLASNLIREFYGWDVRKMATIEIDIVREDQ